ncbi:hypothetical protein GCM10011360_06700 [Primorskyibacter flagellatus]|uniref:DUF35 domain-containing protein n=1 Tax=Primorskyibacter flagellatus TaxID=1387277 RepID=A0A917A032_9RHOB|nr:hypothetical protein [Primorskyibacter flagellatus]GGE20679.1 hypothetical protein GCM10011360_06700 [Primorskyibacter flagellatus]
MDLEKPDLYRLSPDGRSLILRAGRCGACGDLSFPLTPYGCPLCGAEPAQVREEEMDGQARLLTFLTLHTRLTPTLPVPLVVGEAEMANGAIEEIMLDGDESRYSDGMIVRAAPVEISRGDAQVIACRFVPAEG